MCVLSDPHLSLPPDLAPYGEESESKTFMCFVIPLQVAGFHRAVPSTALDKASMQFVYILLIFSLMSIDFCVFWGKSS